MGNYRVGVVGNWLEGCDLVGNYRAGIVGNWTVKSDMVGNYRMGIVGNWTVYSDVLERLPIVSLRYSVCRTHVSDRPTRFTAPGPGGTAGLGHVTVPRWSRTAHRRSAAHAETRDVKHNVYYIHERRRFSRTICSLGQLVTGRVLWVIG